MSVKIGSLFSGYGGLDEGVMTALGGGEVLWHVEFAEAPSKILAHHFPGVPNYGDITTVDWASVPPIDVLTGGFPCQDVSLAGRRAGLTDGTRSGLWSEYARAIDVLRPGLVVIENVRGLLSAEAAGAVEPDPWGMGDGATRPTLNAFGVVLGDLAGLGYDARWCGVRASDAGAPHGRFRVFILAHPNGERRGEGRPESAWRLGRFAPVVSSSLADVEDAYLAASSEWGQSAPGQEEAGRARADTGRRGGAPVADANGGDSDGRECSTRRLEVERTFAAWRSDDSAPDTRGERFGEHTGAASAEEAGPRGGDESHGVGGSRPDTDWGPYRPAIERWERVTGRVAPSPTLPDGKNGGHRLSARLVEWMMGLPAGHVTDPDIGLSRNDQLKALGNGVVPQQAALAVGWLFEQERAA